MYEITLGKHFISSAFTFFVYLAMTQEKANNVHTLH